MVAEYSPQRKSKTNCGHGEKEAWNYGVRTDRFPLELGLHVQLIG
jgi:hypothetical protein